MVKISIKLDINKDAWNWWHACNHISHGVDWKKRIESNLWKNIYQKKFSEAEKYLLPYLNNYYRENKLNLSKVLEDARELFDKKASQACQLMERITKRKLYRDNFICFLTTFPRCPYDYKNGYVWLCSLWSTKCYLGIFIHELLHFQFFKYYRDNQLVKKLDNNQLEKLKESKQYKLTGNRLRAETAVINAASLITVNK